MSPSDHSEYKDYTHNLNENNLENDIHIAISDCYKSQSGFLSGCVFSNIDGMCHYLVLKLISMVNNLTNDNDKKTKPLIMYNTNSYLKYLNDWENEYYFIRIFLTLFPFGDGKYLVKRKMAILLQV